MTRSTDTMTEKELRAELAELQKLDLTDDLTPQHANRMREIKLALKNIRNATDDRSW